MKTRNEKTEHMWMKKRVHGVLDECKWELRFEVKNTDLVAYKPGSDDLWALECERSSRWIVRNAIRDFSNECRHLAIITSSEHVAAKARNILSALPQRIQQQTVVVSITNFTTGFVKNVMESKNNSGSAGKEK